MMPNEAAIILMNTLGLPDGAANVLVWYELPDPSLRVWVDERYFWQLKESAPKVFEGYRVDIEKRPTISAYAS